MRVASLLAGLILVCIPAGGLAQTVDQRDYDELMDRLDRLERAVGRLERALDRRDAEDPYPEAEDPYREAEDPYRQARDPYGNEEVRNEVVANINEMCGRSCGAAATNYCRRIGFSNGVPLRVERRGMGGFDHVVRVQCFD